MIHGDVRPMYISTPQEETAFKLMDRLGNTTSPSKIQIYNIKH